MSATTIDRATRVRSGDQLEPPVAAATKIPAGVIVARNSSGYAVNGAATAANKTLGVSTEMTDNGGGLAGDLKAKVRRNVVANFANSASADEITIADVGNDAYVVDNQTVAKTSDTNARPVAGKIVDVDAAGVWIEFR